MTTPAERIQIESIKTELKERFKSISEEDFIPCCDAYYHCMDIAIHEMYKSKKDDNESVS